MVSTSDANVGTPTFSTLTSYSIICFMSERGKGLSKEYILRQLIKYVALDQEDLYGSESEIYSDSVDTYASLASASGPTDYEISEAYFLGMSKEDRRDLLGVYCEKFWHDKDYKSLDELNLWTENMIKLRDRFYLEDPLEESAQKPGTKVEDLKLSDAFEKDGDRQGLFDLYTLKIKEDDSFPTLDELKKWTTEMLKIKVRYHLEDPLEQQEKAVEAKNLTKSKFRTGSN